MRFIKDVSKEMNKVSWLANKEVWQQFIAVHIISGVMIVYFFGIDLLVNGIKILF